ncbi:MAG TPA: alpha/beta hydrolase [Candidatus Polarisedimenticolia bacterium]|nr:alpha/beta hydrolase [Candidatus Polarisedimenticolia bacterium]
MILLCVLSVPSVKAQATKSGFFKTSDGVRIHYLEAGSGRAIVFIPGWTMPAWIWQTQIDEFSKNYHVIAVDPRSQGESDRPPYGHLPETRARDYKELVDQLGLKQPVLVGWSMACGELVKYAEQFGTDNIAGLVLVDGFLTDQPGPEMFVALSGWMNQLQLDHHKQADGFVRTMYKKPQSDDYLNRVIDASAQVPADTAVVLIYNMIAVKDFSPGLARMNRPVLFTYQPETQQTADFLKSKLGDKLRLERFDGDGHALFVDDPQKFNHVLAEFLQSLPK